MNTPTRASALLALLLAASASAQTAPAVSTSGSAYKNHIEAGYIRASLATSPEDITGFYLNARYYVAGGLFLLADHFDADVYDPIARVGGTFKRTGLGAGYELAIGPGRVIASATLGDFKADAGAAGSSSFGQTRLCVAYEQALLDSLTASLAVHQTLNSEFPSQADLTTWSLGLGYDLGRGLSLQATYCPEELLLGLDYPVSGWTASVGLRYAF